MQYNISTACFLVSYQSCNVFHTQPVPAHIRRSPPQGGPYGAPVAHSYIAQRRLDRANTSPPLRGSTSPAASGSAPRSYAAQRRMSRQEGEDPVQMGRPMQQQAGASPFAAMAAAKTWAAKRRASSQSPPPQLPTSRPSRQSRPPSIVTSGGPPRDGEVRSPRLSIYGGGAAPLPIPPLTSPDGFGALQHDLSGGSLGRGVALPTEMGSAPQVAYPGEPSSQVALYNAQAAGYIDQMAESNAMIPKQGMSLSPPLVADTQLEQQQQGSAPPLTRLVGPLAAGIQKIASLGGSRTGSLTHTQQATAAAAPSSMPGAIAGVGLGTDINNPGPISAEQHLGQSMVSAAPEPSVTATAASPSALDTITTTAAPVWVAPFASVGSIRRSGRWPSSSQPNPADVPPHPPGTVTVEIGALGRGFMGIRSPLKADKGLAASGYITTGGKRQVPEPGPSVSC